MLAHITGRTENTPCTNGTKRAKPNRLHEVFHKTGIDSVGLNTVVLQNRPKYGNSQKQAHNTK